MIFEFRYPVLAAVLYIVLSLPSVSTIIDGMVERTFNYSSAYLNLLVKASLVFVLYYAFEKFVIEPNEIKKVRDEHSFAVLI